MASIQFDASEDVNAINAPTSECEIIPSCVDIYDDEDNASSEFLLMAWDAALTEMAYLFVYENPKNYKRKKMLCTFARATIQEWMSPMCSPNKIHRALCMRREVIIALIYF